MKKAIVSLFDLLKNEQGTVDITELKAHLHQENINNLNPTLFKRVNDMAKISNFEGQMT
jgi:hypothetical protein